MKVESDMTPAERQNMLRAKVRHRDLMSKCYNDFDEHYLMWGGSGVKVCKRWHVFENFYDDVGDKGDEFILLPIVKHLPIGPDNFKWRSKHEPLAPDIKVESDGPTKRGGARFRPEVLAKTVRLVKGPTRQTCIVTHYGERVNIYDICMTVKQMPATVYQKLSAYRRKTGSNEFTLDDFLRDMYNQTVPGTSSHSEHSP